MNVGILGGGQLGRMLALAGLPLGMRFRVLEAKADAPAARAAEHIRADYDDDEALDRFARGLDVITYEFENVPVDAARRLATHVPVRPTPEALAICQDRLTEKEYLRGLGIPTVEYEAVATSEEVREAATRIGLPAVLKTRRFGYDGKGQRVIRAMDEIDEASGALGDVPLILESFVEFERELSILAVRDAGGVVACYPLVENEHRDGVLAVSHAPAENVDAGMQVTAEDYAAWVLETLDYVGVLAIEFFQADGALIANEMAPRVHNSGHWTIEGASISQFENHVRAVAGLPLGPTDAVGASVMWNLLGEVPRLDRLLERMPGAHVHLYEKEPRPSRKLGHVTMRAARTKKPRDGERRHGADVPFFAEPQTG